MNKAYYWFINHHSVHKKLKETLSTEAHTKVYLWFFNNILQSILINLAYIIDKAKRIIVNP